MDPVDVVAVVGVCAGERAAYAQRLATATGRMLVPARSLLVGHDPLERAEELAPWSPSAAGAVIEFPTDVSALDIIGTLAGKRSATRLIGIVCLVDATHILDDIQRDDYAVQASPLGRGDRIYTSRALLAITQMEYASTIVLVNWDALETNDLSTAIAIVNTVSPRARVRLERRTEASDLHLEYYDQAQTRPGWVAILNEECPPHMTDPRVRSFRYEHIRPLHPGRLEHLLDERIQPGEFGIVLRSAGFCRFATTPHITTQWDHVGQMISLTPLMPDAPSASDDEVLSFGQDLAIIGLDLNVDGLTAALDETALTDDEFAAGPMVWATFPDPFPERQTTAPES